MNYCSNCGAKLKEGADVCLKCGKILKNVKNLNFNFTTDIPEGFKSRIVALILALLFGSIGIHNFYLGYSTKGLIQLTLTVVGWIILIGPFISTVWALIEFILLLTGSISVDGYGKKLV